ncbi:hypothetical protein Sste5344_005564 [Sporothrix stenoceras]
MHDDACKENPALAEVLRLAREKKWQQCYACKRIIELSAGCNHISCLCGAQFCYPNQQRQHPAIPRVYHDAMGPVAVNTEINEESFGGISDISVVSDDGDDDDDNDTSNGGEAANTGQRISNILGALSTVESAGMSMDR